MPFTLENPPEWYAPWLRQSLCARAKRTIRHEWPSMAQRAEARWSRTQQLTAATRANRARIEQENGEKQEDVLARPGGRVHTGEEAELLAPGALLDLEKFASIKFSEEKSWTVPAIANQLKLRNLCKDKRSSALSRLLQEAHTDTTAANYVPLLGRAESLIVTGRRAELIARVERVLRLEERAAVLVERTAQLEAVDIAQAAQDSRRRRVRRLPSHLRDG